MEAQLYRVVLTGEIMEGYDPEKAIHALATLFKQAPEALRKVFPHRSIPLNRDLQLDKARQIQARLHAVGAVCVLQAVGVPRAPANFLTDEPAPRAKEVSPFAPTVNCPKCGHVQPEAPECARCGLIFAKWRLEVTESPGDVPDEDELLRLFLHSNAEKYLRKFGKFRADDGYAFTWHWPAFFFGPLWALYRKMWGWAAIMFVVSLVPLAAFLWGFTANFIYYRRAKSRITALGRRPDGDRVAAAGGTSAVAVLLGIGIGLLVGYLVMAPIFEKAVQQGMQSAGSVARLQEAAGKTPEGRKTANVLRATVLMANIWVATGKDVRAISLQTLAHDMGQPMERFKDGWGNPVELRPTATNYVVISAGPDGQFGSEDDLSLEPPPSPWARKR